jgi:hypothetical protein
MVPMIRRHTVLAFFLAATVLLAVAAGSRGAAAATYSQSEDVLRALARVSTTERTRRALTTHRELRVVLGNDVAAHRGADRLIQATRGVATRRNAADMYEQMLTEAKQRIPGERLAALTSSSVEAAHLHEMQLASEPPLRTLATADEAAVRAILERVMSEHGAA